MEDFRLLDESFILLQGITVDSTGHVLVIGNSSIYICAQNGRFWEVIIPSEEEDLHSPKCLAHSTLGQIVVTQVGLDNRHEVSVFEYLSEDYHSLKCVPYLTYEGRMKQHMMRKAKSLDSAVPTCSKYFSSHVNGYIAPINRKAASQKTRSSKSKSTHRKALHKPVSGDETKNPTIVINGEVEHNMEEKTGDIKKTKNKAKRSDIKTTKVADAKDKKTNTGTVSEESKLKDMNSVTKKQVAPPVVTNCDETKDKVNEII